MNRATLGTTDFEHLLVESLDDGVHVVTLNRPDQLNALHQGLFDELDLLCEVVEDDPTVRVVVLTGAGRGFCAGADLGTITELPSTSVTDFLRAQEAGARVIARFKRLPVPVVAAVNGPTAGGGLALALAADVRISSDAAFFTVAFVRLGLSGCDVGVSWLLPRVVGMGQASLLMLTGRRITAEEAERIGLVTEVVAPDRLLPAAFELAHELASISPLALKLTKEGLELNIDAQSLDSAIALENRNQVLASRSEDAVEAMRAFMAGEPARFTGR
ncbi:enoyl-CoA hydratase/isomerase family protein [Nocardioides stalactiti]|uniref:enoyl-CoA hydratase/isomerase family protein n=1 Tax=Nocardioides stalactiti TaxID=2755356 RepID=UPI001602871B|nr:enoyl-CoA hydratase/isomerase family protein [Nocardioides stalactiti]